MTPEDRAARKALLSLARWARKEAREELAAARFAEAAGEYIVAQYRMSDYETFLSVASEANRRARRIK